MVTIVSGLPRSGTSMMMQMLEAGGLPPLTDNVRKPDEDNPRGYYEFEKVKNLEDDNSWLDLAEGKALKVVSPLLFHLPLDRSYKVLFIHRDISEVLASQARMLERRRIEDKGADNESMKGYFKDHLKKVKAWLSNQEAIEVHDCQNRQVLSHPTESVTAIREFLNLPLDIEKMASVIDESLHRQRSEYGS